MKEGKDRKSSMNAYSRKGRVRKKLYTNVCDNNNNNKREREKRTDHKCLWQRKKEQTTNVGGKRKMAALIRQASKQLTPNERKTKPQKLVGWQTRKKGCPNQASK